jgi:hypothetical protein
MPTPAGPPTTPTISPGICEYAVTSQDIEDNNIRSDIADTAGSSESDITVDLEDGGVTQALVKINDLTALPVPSFAIDFLRAELVVYTNSASDGNIFAYRMIQEWGPTTAWSDFEGNNGAQPDGVVAESTPSLVLNAPRSDRFVTFDITSDVELWSSNPSMNQGWVFINDSGDGWDFYSTEYENGFQRPTFRMVYSAPCADTPPPVVTPAPIEITLAPVTPFPTPPPGVLSYVPGDLSVQKLGLQISRGLDLRVIAQTAKPVKFTNGGESTDVFHFNPDGAATFPCEADETPAGCYYYISNAETSDGGCGSIKFDADHNVIGYQRVLTGTSNNCGGGRSPYNTWLSCEEFGDSGRVWEVSGNGSIAAQTNLVSRGGNWESTAFHVDPTRGGQHVYYITEDASDGPVLQSVPLENLGTREEMYGAMEYKYLRLDEGDSGTFSWEVLEENATPELYPGSEGIDVKGDMLYFVAKQTQRLFILDLLGGTFTAESTITGSVSYLAIGVCGIIFSYLLATNNPFSP